MPLYEYRCRACGLLFELLVRSSERPCCASCSAVDVERVLSTFAVSSEARSHAALQTARRELTVSKDRQERIRHEQDEVREHVQEDRERRTKN